MCATPREILPSRRRCISQKVKVDKQTVHYSVGLYPDGRPGELFIEVAKAGAALRTWAGEAAMMLSVAIQHGTPLDVALNLFIGSRSDPHGKVTGHPCILKCSSIMDLIARDMAITFLNRIDLADVDNCHPCLVIVSNREPSSMERALNAGPTVDSKRGESTEGNADAEPSSVGEGVRQDTEEICSRCSEETTRPEDCCAASHIHGGNEKTNNEVAITTQT